MKIADIFDHQETGKTTETVDHGNLFVIFAEEIRQYFYCKRIIYWRRVAEVSGTPSYLMSIGTRYHKKRQKNIYLRKDDLITHRNRLFIHTPLAFGGKLDVCREQSDRIIAVEYKRFRHSRQPFQSHIIQAILGGMAAEYELGKRLTDIEIQYYQGKRITIPVKNHSKKQVLTTLDEIRNMVELEILPEPTSNKKKCEVCEFFKICQGV